LRFTAGKPVLLSDARDGFLFDRLFGSGLGCEDRRLFEMRKRIDKQIGGYYLSLYSNQIQ
jgi:hypothetical protein